MYRTSAFSREKLKVKSPFFGPLSGVHPGAPHANEVASEKLAARRAVAQGGNAVALRSLEPDADRFGMFQK